MKAVVQSETRYGISIYVPKPQLRYLDEFIKLSCAVDLLAWSLFPNAKEITESMAAYAAVRANLWGRGFSPSDPQIRCVCVGDGSTPRTGALFALRTKWNVWSVDPRLGHSVDWNAINRLNMVRTPVEEFHLGGKAPVVIVAVHSHASLPFALQAVEARLVAVVANPCCVAQTLEREPDVMYEDMGIASPERTVKVWRFNREEKPSEDQQA